MEKKIKELEKIIKYNFKKSSLLEKALTHKSYDNISNNEKLEFLDRKCIWSDLVLHATEFIPFFPNNVSLECSSSGKRGTESATGASSAAGRRRRCEFFVPAPNWR